MSPMVPLGVPAAVEAEARPGRSSLEARPAPGPLLCSALSAQPDLAPRGARHLVEQLPTVFDRFDESRIGLAARAADAAETPPAARPPARETPSRGGPGRRSRARRRATRLGPCPHPPSRGLEPDQPPRLLKLACPGSSPGAGPRRGRCSGRGERDRHRSPSTVHPLARSTITTTPVRGTSPDSFGAPVRSSKSAGARGSAMVSTWMCVATRGTFRTRGLLKIKGHSGLRWSSAARAGEWPPATRGARAAPHLRWRPAGAPRP
jgi:hypothetical protein